MAPAGIPERCSNDLLVVKRQHGQVQDIMPRCLCCVIAARRPLKLLGSGWQQGGIKHAHRLAAAGVPIRIIKKNSHLRDQQGCCCQNEVPSCV